MEYKKEKKKKEGYAETYFEPSQENEELGQLSGSDCSCFSHLQAYVNLSPHFAVCLVLAWLSFWRTPL